MTSVFPTPSLFLNRGELAALLGRADAPCVLDVRRSERFALSRHGLPTARYVPPDQLPAFIEQHRPQAAIVCCVHGHELSQGAALFIFGEVALSGEEARATSWSIDPATPHSIEPTAKSPSAPR